MRMWHFRNEEARLVANYDKVMAELSLICDLDGAEGAKQMSHIALVNRHAKCEREMERMSLDKRWKNLVERDRRICGLQRTCDLINAELRRRIRFNASQRFQLIA